MTSEVRNQFAHSNLSASAVFPTYKTISFSKVKYKPCWWERQISGYVSIGVAKTCFITMASDLTLDVRFTRISASVDMVYLLLVRNFTISCQIYRSQPVLIVSLIFHRHQFIYYFCQNTSSQIKYFEGTRRKITSIKGGRGASATAGCRWPRYGHGLTQQNRTRGQKPQKRTIVKSSRYL